MTNLSTLVNDFYRDVTRKQDEVDPDSNQDWYSLTLGYGLAKGLTPDEAHEFARYIRYETELG